MLKILSAPILALSMASLSGAALPAAAQEMHAMNHNAIQPETTLNISATAEIIAEPDVAWLTGGVTSEGETAKDALAQNAANMAGVYRALEAAGIARKNIQTSNFSLQPKYTYPKNAERILDGYIVSNQVTVKVTELDKIGGMIDAMVALGGNTFNGVRFGLLDSSEVMNEARRKAMKEAMARAELYADVTGYQVARIVTINESGGYNPSPQPVMMRAAAMDMAESTQISGGEQSYSMTVNVEFELRK